MLAVSYGGTLVLHGKKGTREVAIPKIPETGKCPADSRAAIDACPSDSGTSWVRLAKTIPSAIEGSDEDSRTTLYVDRPVPTWEEGDQIVLTSTDYLSSHSEELTIKAPSKEIDCPTFGCFGFRVTLPSSFTTGTKEKPIPPPDPTTFTRSGDTYFDAGAVKFVPVNAGISGKACDYNAISARAQEKSHFH